MFFLSFLVSLVNINNNFFCFRDELVSLPISEIYPPLPQLEYPKMLIEEFQLESQEDEKRQKALKKEEERRAAQIAEETRLKIETDNFRKQMEKARFNGK